MIKAIIFFLSFYFLNAISFSQTAIENYQKFLKSGDYINAKKEIDNAANDPLNSKVAKIWLCRGEINSLLYTHKPAENPGSIEIAYMSVMKASSLDTKKELSKDIAVQIKTISQLYFNKGATEFNNNKYTVALLSFERSADVGNLINPSVANPETYYYAGISAALANNVDKERKYLLQLSAQNYPKVEVYNYLADLYKSEKNNSGAIEAYKKGINLFPNNSYILIVNIVKLFLNLGLTSEALEYLKKGTALNPTQAELFNLQGSLFTQLKQDNDAKQSYVKAVELNPNHPDAVYNLGIIYYNSSINHLKTADSFVNSNPEKYNSEKEIFLTEIKKAAPLLEKALEQDGSNKNTMICLLDIYKRLQRKELYDKLKIRFSSTK